MRHDAHRLLVLRRTGEPWAETNEDVECIEGHQARFGGAEKLWILYTMFV